MPKMQEQFSAMYRMYGTLNQGFRNANLLALRLMNAVSSANGRQNAGTWYPVRGTQSFRRGSGKTQALNSPCGCKFSNNWLRRTLW